MMRKLGLAVIFLALGSVAALAADFNGKWNGEVQGRMGTQTIVFDFHVDGTTLTGKVTTPRGETDITDGKVDGDNISFTQKMSFNGNDVTINYTGKADGDTIKFTRAVGDRPAQDFVAKRGDAAAPPPAAPPQ
jgi:opacity protein-like surface antigen